ncbi:hypothetical protein ABVT39_000705 [Epinephelus coioides]
MSTGGDSTTHGKVATSVDSTPHLAQATAPGAGMSEIIGIKDARMFFTTTPPPPVKVATSVDSTPHLAQTTAPGAGMSEIIGIKDARMFLQRPPCCAASVRAWAIHQDYPAENFQKVTPSGQGFLTAQPPELTATQETSAAVAALLVVQGLSAGEAGSAQGSGGVEPAPTAVEDCFNGTFEEVGESVNSFPNGREEVGGTADAQQRERASISEEHGPSPPPPHPPHRRLFHEGISTEALWSQQESLFPSLDTSLQRQHEVSKDLFCTSTPVKAGVADTGAASAPAAGRGVCVGNLPTIPTLLRGDNYIPDFDDLLDSTGDYRYSNLPNLLTLSPVPASYPPPPSDFADVVVESGSGIAAAAPATSNAAVIVEIGVNNINSDNDNIASPCLCCQFWDCECLSCECVSDRGVSAEHAAAGSGAVSVSGVNVSDRGVSAEHADAGSGAVNVSGVNVSDRGVSAEHAAAGSGAVNVSGVNVSDRGVSAEHADAGSGAVNVSGVNVSDRGVSAEHAAAGSGAVNVSGVTVSDRGVSAEHAAAGSGAVNVSGVNVSDRGVSAEHAAAGSVSNSMVCQHGAGNPVEGTPAVPSTSTGGAQLRVRDIPRFNAAEFRQRVDFRDVSLDNITQAIDGVRERLSCVIGAALESSPADSVLNVVLRGPSLASDVQAVLISDNAYNADEFLEVVSQVVQSNDTSLTDDDLEFVVTVARGSSGAGSRLSMLNNCIAL